MSTGDQLRGVRQAGKQLAIDGGVIAQVAHVNHVPMAEIQEFQARPPADCRGRKRVGEILQTDGPLLQVEYSLASGQSRSAWIDVLLADTARAA